MQSWKRRTFPYIWHIWKKINLIFLTETWFGNWWSFRVSDSHTFSADEKQIVDRETVKNTEKLGQM